MPMGVGSAMPLWKTNALEATVAGSRMVSDYTRAMNQSSTQHRRLVVWTGGLVKGRLINRRSWPGHRQDLATASGHPDLRHINIHLLPGLLDGSSCCRDAVNLRCGLLGRRSCRDGILGLVGIWKRPPRPLRCGRLGLVGIGIRMRK